MKCNECKGNGLKLGQDPREWQPENFVCSACNGTGRSAFAYPSVTLPPPAVAKGFFPSVPGDPADKDYYTAKQLLRASYDAVDRERANGAVSLDARYIARLKDALSWAGESTPESLEECAIDQNALVRRLIDATVKQRDAAFAERVEPVVDAAGGPKDHVIREAVNKLRDVAIRFHHTGQLRARIQEVVLPLLGRG